MNSSLPHFSIPFHRINICFLAILILTGVFLSPLVTGTGVHDGQRMGKIFFFAQWMLLVIPVGMVVFIREWKQPVGLYSLLVLLWFGWIIVRDKTRYREAVGIRTEAEKYYKDEFGSTTPGDCYKAVGETLKAVEQYQLIANMVPHNFFTLYLLAKLYNETGQHEMKGDNYTYLCQIGFKLQFW